MLGLNELTAGSLQQLVRTLPYVEKDRQAQLVRSAESMLSQTDSNREQCSGMWLEECLSDIGEACRYYNEQADNLLAG